KVSDIVAEIAAASREQSAGIGQVNQAVLQMDELTQQNAALVEQATAASQAMAQQSQALHEMMSGYRLGERSGMDEAALSAQTPASPQDAAGQPAAGSAHEPRELADRLSMHPGVAAGADAGKAAWQDF